MIYVKRELGPPGCGPRLAGLLPKVAMKQVLKEFFAMIALFVWILCSLLAHRQPCNGLRCELSNSMRNWRCALLQFWRFSTTSGFFMHIDGSSTKDPHDHSGKEAPWS